MDTIKFRAHGVEWKAYIAKKGGKRFPAIALNAGGGYTMPRRYGDWQTTEDAADWAHGEDGAERAARAIARQQGVVGIAF